MEPRGPLLGEACIWYQGSRGHLERPTWLWYTDLWFDGNVVLSVMRKEMMISRIAIGSCVLLPILCDCVIGRLGDCEIVCLSTITQ
eukprot:4087392-Lingulodinium_polyedra.AAC.2